VFEFPNFYAVVLRKGEQIFAFDNACPHLKLPFFEPTPAGKEQTKSVSRVNDNAVLKCRWHESCFDLTSEIVSWCEALDDEGKSTTTPSLGDISKNRAPLKPHSLARGSGPYLARARLRPKRILRLLARETCPRSDRYDVNKQTAAEITGKSGNWQSPTRQ
jgi:hypothetical protein